MIIKINKIDGGVSIMRIIIANSDVKEEIAKAFPKRNKDGKITGIDKSIVSSWSEIEEYEIPTDRTYRDAWDGDFNIDLVKAKGVHKGLIVRKAHERITPDAFGEKDFSKVKSELDAIDFDAIDNMDDLMAAWPKSIDRNKNAR